MDDTVIIVLPRDHAQSLYHLLVAVQGPRAKQAVIEIMAAVEAALKVGLDVD